MARTREVARGQEGGGRTRNTSRTSGDEVKWKRDKGAAGEEKEGVEEEKLLRRTNGGVH